MYSKWIKTDLHIHTDMSKITKQNDYSGVFSVDVLVSNLKKHEINMISLTDHNIINCAAYKEIIARDIKVLIGVELDVALSDDSLKYYVQQLSTNRSTKITERPFHVLVLFRSSDFQAISMKLENMFSDVSANLLSGIADLTKDKMFRITSLKYIINHFRDEDFFIIAHGNKDKGIVEPYKTVARIEDAQYEILVGGISALEMKSNVKMENVISKYNEGFEKLLNDDFCMKKPTSYVVFSDNHDCTNYQPRSYQTWVKGDASFETLRLAFSDPESRVHTGTQPPSHVTNYMKSIQLKLKGTEEQRIEFSPNLNVIIGGRSSGKSLLFNTLVRLNNEFGLEEKEVFRQNYSRLVDLDKTIVKLNTTEFDHNYSLVGDAYYQESIIRLFDNNGNLGERLTNEFPKIDEAEIRQREALLDRIFSDFGNAYSSYFSIANKINKGSINKQIEIALKTSAKLFDVDLSKLHAPDNRTAYKKLKDNLTKFRNELRKLESLELDGSNLFDEDELKQIKLLDDLLVEKVHHIDNIEKRKTVTFLFKKKTSAVIDDYIKKELSHEKQIIESTRTLLTNNLDDYRQFFKTKLLLRQSCNNIEKVQIAIPDKTNCKYKYSFVTKVNLDIDYKRIVSEFFGDKILNYATESSLYQNMIHLADGEKRDVRLKYCASDGKSPIKLSERLEEFVKGIKSKRTYEIIEKGSDGSTVSTLSTSQGKKASIFIDITLNNLLQNPNKKVLLIDQLEDNIDNKFISQDIVSLIRDLKNRVQVILVTHNPSIAIYGDAENIIIAENDGETIKYHQGGLENIKIREEACIILDGGEVAFKNRMDKYNIEILLREEV